MYGIVYFMMMYSMFMLWLIVGVMIDILKVLS